jgi:hypothetical protein
VHAGVLLRNAEKNCSMVNTVIESRFPRSPDLIRLKKNLDLKFLKKCFLYLFISAQVEDDEREGGQGDMTMISFLIHHPIQIFHSLAHSF